MSFPIGKIRNTMNRAFCTKFHQNVSNLETNENCQTSENPLKITTTTITTKLKLQTKSKTNPTRASEVPRLCGTILMSSTVALIEGKVLRLLKIDRRFSRNILQEFCKISK